MSKSINLFATKSDIEQLLLALESILPVKYVRAGMSDNPTVETYPTVTDIPALGQAPSPDQNHCPVYLIIPATATVNIEPVEQRKGGIRYAVYQDKNPASLALRSGGVYENCCVIAGQIGTCTNDPDSIEMMNVVTRLARRHYERIRSYFVGPEAKELMANGFRLTANAQTPEEYDLTLS